MANRSIRKSNPFSYLNLLWLALIFGAIGASVIIHSFAAPNPNLSGDLNGDNKVDSSDLTIILANFGTNYAGADINGNGTVDISDFSTVLSYFGQTYSGGGGGSVSGGVTTANIWVAQGGTGCAYHATPISYPGLSGSCSSLNAAAAVCSNDAVVGIQTSLTSSQTISATNGRTAGHNCIMANAKGATVTIGSASDQSVDITGNYITIDGSYGAVCQTSGIDTNTPDSSCMGIKSASYTSNGQPLQARWGLDGTGDVLKHVDIGMVTNGGNGTILYSDLGPSTWPYNSNIESNGVTFSDNFIHDITTNSGSNHIECIIYDAGQSVVVSHNMFKNCSTYGIFNKPDAGATVSALIDSNGFWNPAGYTINADLDSTDDTSPGTITCNHTVTNNSFSEGFQNACPGISQSGNLNGSPSVMPTDSRRPG